MTKRIPNDIFGRILDDNRVVFASEHSKIEESLLKLREELVSNHDLKLISDDGPDSSFWNKYLQSGAMGKNWLDSPWLFTEFYFYRRVIESFNYFDSRIDPFKAQKQAGLRAAIDHTNSYLTVLTPLLSAVMPMLEKGKQSSDIKQPESSSEIVVDTVTNILSYGIYASLFGNKMDLSLYPVDLASGINNNNGGVGNTTTSSVSHSSIQEMNDTLKQMISCNSEHIISSQSEIVVAHMLDNYSWNTKGSTINHSKTHIDIICDNAGYELVTDLILGYICLKLNITGRVVYHTKGFPTFVSDATTDDVMYTLRSLQDMGENYPLVGAMASEMLQYITDGRVHIQDNLCWCQPIAFYSLEKVYPDVAQMFVDTSVVFIKGDANYRKLLGK